jgi:stage V sporulation protein G
MEITEITITLRDEDKLKAFVNVTFDNCFVVRGMKVIKGATGYFVSMPSRKMEDGTYRDIAHPINNEFRQYLEREIMHEYRKALEEQGLPVEGEVAQF